MKNRYRYDRHGKLRGYTSDEPPSPSSNDGFWWFFFIIIGLSIAAKAYELSVEKPNIFYTIITLIIIGILAFFRISSIYRHNQLLAKQKEEAATEEQRRNVEEQRRNVEEQRKLRLTQLRNIPTSTTGFIHGHSIDRQIQAVHVDDFRDRIDAEIAFFSKVEEIGGTGVINLQFRRSTGGFISISGNAVTVVPKRKKL